MSYQSHGKSTLFELVVRCDTQKQLFTLTDAPIWFCNAGGCVAEHQIEVINIVYKNMSILKV